MFGDSAPPPGGGRLLRPVFAALVVLAASVEALSGPVEDDRTELALTRCAHATVPIAAFEAWFETMKAEHAFRYTPCPPGPRSYAHMIKTRDLVPTEVQVSVILEMGPQADWIFLAAVEEPRGQGECLG